MSIERDISENETMYRERQEFVRVFEKAMDREDLIEFSRFHANIVFFGVTYSKDIMKKLDKLYNNLTSPKKKSESKSRKKE